MCIRDYFIEQYKHTALGRKWQRIHIAYTLLFIVCIVVIASTTLLVISWRSLPTETTPKDSQAGYIFYEDAWQAELNIKTGDKYYYGQQYFPQSSTKALLSRVVSYNIYLIVILVAGFIVLEFRKGSREDRYVNGQVDNFTSLFGCTVCF